MLSVEAVNDFRRQARCVVRELGLLNDAYCNIGVTLAERHLLIELATVHESPTMKEIAERLLLEKSTVSRLIARALKKGYISTTCDNKDRRKRYLHLTEHGRRTLDAFERIAFNQTKEALLALTADEAETAQKGMALYAAGLTRSRTQSKQPARSPFNMSIGADFALHHFSPEDEAALFSIFQEVVGTDGYFPNESNSFQEFQIQFFAPASQVFVCTLHETGEVVGGFYIKPNCRGRGAHIANAAYMVTNRYRGKGLGTKLVEVSLKLALEHGYRAMQYNMVLSGNTRALALYKKIGFRTIGCIPEAILNGDGSYQDGYILHKDL